MDKYEYKVCLEEIDTLISEGDFGRAVEIADTIDWKRVKSVNTLCQISDLYKVNHRFTTTNSFRSRRGIPGATSFSTRSIKRRA